MSAVVNVFLVCFHGGSNISTGKIEKSRKLRKTTKINLLKKTQNLTKRTYKIILSWTTFSSKSLLYSLRLSINVQGKAMTSNSKWKQIDVKQLANIKYRTEFDTTHVYCTYLRTFARMKVVRGHEGFNGIPSSETFG